MNINNLSASALSYFTGTESYTYGPFRKFVMTDGVTYLCQNGVAWFVDLIASHQTAALRKKADGMQVWKLQQLKDDKQHMAVAICEDGNYNELTRQLIEYTDFPFDRFADGMTVWLQEGYVPQLGECLVALLPSEY